MAGKSNREILLERLAAGCPVCGLKGGEYPGYICTRCGWERELTQEEYPDMGGGANVMALNEAKRAYKEGREVK